MNADTPLQLLGGLTAAEFLRDYWQRKPLLVRQAIPDFESPLSADELAGLSLEESVESRIVLEHGKTRGKCAVARSRRRTTSTCRNRTGPCWSRRSTSSSRKSPNCWSNSASCPAGGSTT